MQEGGGIIMERLSKRLKLTTDVILKQQELMLLLAQLAKLNTEVKGDRHD